MVWYAAGVKCVANNHPLLPDCGLVMKYCENLQAAPRQGEEGSTRLVLKLGISYLFKYFCS